MESKDFISVFGYGLGLIVFFTIASLITVYLGMDEQQALLFLIVVTFLLSLIVNWDILFKKEKRGNLKDYLVVSDLLKNIEYIEKNFRKLSIEELRRLDKELRELTEFIDVNKGE